MNKEEFIKEIEKLNIDYKKEMLDKLEIFHKFLLEENKKTNLTRIIEKEDVFLKHFYDSLTILKIYDVKKAKKVCDVGSGAGFPGIVLKIFFPEINLVLIDSNNKKTKFLNKAIEKLDLKETTVIKTRIEDHKSKYDLIITRAVARMNILIELCVPLLVKEGNLIIMKGNAEEEIKESKNALKELNSTIIKIEKFLLPFEKSNRTLIKIKKEKENLLKYPRKYDKILKKPL